MGLEALPVAGYSVLQNGLKRRFFSQSNEIDFLSNFIPGVQQVCINDPSKLVSLQVCHTLGRLCDGIFSSLQGWLCVGVLCALQCAKNSMGSGGKFIAGICAGCRNRVTYNTQKSIRIAPKKSPVA